VTTTRRLVLLRHGRTAWNAERRFQGQADPPLDDVGVAQAYVVADLIAALQPDVVVSSDASRAMQTAVPVAERIGLDVLPDARLRERSLGHWEGLTRDEVAARYPDEFADWIAGRDVSRRGGETRADVAARAYAAFRELPDVPVALIVTHSATAMALSSALLGLDPGFPVLGPLANCHWTELSCDSDSGWRLRAHNIGVPGVVVPVPVRGDVTDEAPDAEA
jgi:probable phosphoglycerate mutase